MKQLSGLDASFLYLETASQFGHVASLSTYVRPGPDYDPFAAWYAQIAGRLHLVEPLRRKLRNVPFGLDHPFWVEDPDFDLDFHVRHTAVPPPGTDEQLADLVARVVARPLDRRRPLWESWVIEGLPDERFAILTKVHHATIDGAAGAELMLLMLDGEGSGPPSVDGEGSGPPPVDGEGSGPPPSEDQPAVPFDALPRGEHPSDLELLARAGINLTRKPARAVVLGARTTRDLGRAVRNPVMVAAANQVRGSLRGPLGAVLNLGRPRQPEGEVSGPLPSVAPRTPFNAPITPHRRFAFRSADLNLVKAIKNALGASVNDVVMAVCAGGLRTWLEAHDALPDRPLVAMVPVSVRTGRETERWTNRVSAVFADLPTDEPDPLRRVARVHAAMGGAKELFAAVPATALTDFAQFPPPLVFARAMRTATRLAARTTPFNLVVSNVPGPRTPLYSAGARLEHYYPVSVITDGQGLNVTVQSYLDTLDFGLIACRELVPDLWAMADAMVDDVDKLAAAAGVG